MKHQGQNQLQTSKRRQRRLMILSLISLAFAAPLGASAKDDAVTEKVVKDFKMPAPSDVDSSEPAKNGGYDLGYHFKSASDTLKPWNTDTESYPDGALHKAFEEEMTEMKKTEEKEQEDLQTKAEYERRKVESERQIQAKRLKVEQLRMKQDEMASDIESMKAELVSIQGKQEQTEKDLGIASGQESETASKSKEIKTELDKTKLELTAALNRLQKARESTNRNINKSMVDMQRMRAEIATAETDIARADNDRARTEGEELQVRSQWASLQSRYDQTVDERKKSLAELRDLQTRLEAAKSDYRETKNELDEAERAKLVTENEVKMQRITVTNEIRNIESQIAAARDSKVSADLEVVRYKAEADKLNQNLAMVRERNKEAQIESESSQGIAMESRLSMETAKAELSRELSSEESAKLKKRRNGSKTPRLSLDC